LEGWQEPYEDGEAGIFVLGVGGFGLSDAVEFFYAVVGCEGWEGALADEGIEAVGGERGLLEVLDVVDAAEGVV
jgi:hypothetical protein